MDPTDVRPGALDALPSGVGRALVAWGASPVSVPGTEILAR